MASIWKSWSACAWTAAGLLAVGCCLTGCSGGDSGSSARGADADQRLTQLLHIYQAYVHKNQKGPPNEQALREFAQKLTSKEREDFAIGQDIETIWVSPRDSEKFQVQYNVRLNPGQTQAIAWEKTGKDGLRYVALSTGYVSMCDEETFRGYVKK